MKKHSFIILFAIISFGCNLDTSIPISDATGNIDEVIVIMEKFEWQGALGDTVRNYFTEAYDILPQYEPIFDVRYLEPSGFTSILTAARNVVIFDVLNNDSSTKLNYNLFGDGLKSGEKMLIKKDVYAGGQQILTVFANNLTDLLSFINEKNTQLVKLVADNENNKLENTLYLGGEDKQLSKHLKNKLNIDLKVPEGYKMAKEDDNMMWFRFDSDKYTANLVLQIFDATGTTSLLNANESFDETPKTDDFGIIARNAFGQKYVEGTSDGSYMTTEDLLDYFQTPKTVNNLEILESRGLWKLTKDFLGGPFINYKIEDEAKNRTLVMDAFIMAPSGKKRQVMRQLEYLMNSVSL